MKHVFWGATIIILSVFLCTSIGSAVTANRNISEGTYQYREERSGRNIPFLWHISYLGDVVEIRVETAEYKTINRCKIGGETIYWSARKQKDGSEISAVRHNDELVITLSEGGGQTTTINKKIDDLPWFQPLSYSLRDFLAADQKSITFWTIRMDTNQAVKLEAKKVGSERLSLDNQTVEATKVEIRCAGVLSAFWSGTYWYDDRGLFLKFRNKASYLSSLKGIVFVQKMES